ncbi:MAG: hypothetical protein WD531_02035 [Nitrosopumilaceae archaeon]
MITKYTDEKMTEFESILQLRKLLAENYKIEKVEPRMFTSDAEVNIAIVTLVSPEGKTQTIKAYREESHALREFVRNLH